MAVKSAKKGNSNSKGNTAKGDEYRYGNDSFGFWSDETVLQIGARRNMTRGKLDVQVTIVNRDEDGKFVKLEDGKIDRGVFFLGVDDCIRLKTGLEDILDEESDTTGVLIQHLNEETNSGNQLEIINDDEGFTVSISYFENGEIDEDTTWTYVCRGNIDIREYDSNFDIQTQSVDRDITVLLELFSSIVPVLVLGPTMLETAGGSRSSSQNNNGSMNLRKSKRKTLGSKVLDDEDEEEEDNADDEDEEEVKPTKKKITKKKATTTKSGATSKTKKKATKENIKSLLDDDDE